MTSPNLPSIAAMLVEYERALAYTESLWSDLTPEQVAWRPNDESSAIGWHLGHQPAVAHFMVRNLTSAEPSPDPELDALMDSATPEQNRGELPSPVRLGRYRENVADRVRFHIGNIVEGQVGAPEQLGYVAQTLLISIINHEYQHDKWIGEVRSDQFGLTMPDLPSSDLLSLSDGYVVVAR